MDKGIRRRDREGKVEGGGEGRSRTRFSLTFVVARSSGCVSLGEDVLAKGLFLRRCILRELWLWLWFFWSLILFNVSDEQDSLS